MTGETFSALLGEAPLGLFELGASPYPEPGDISIENNRQAQITTANAKQASIRVADNRQALITIESE